MANWAHHDMNHATELQGIGACSRLKCLVENTPFHFEGSRHLSKEQSDSLSEWEKFSSTKPWLLALQGASREKQELSLNKGRHEWRSKYQMTKHPRSKNSNRVALRHCQMFSSTKYDMYFISIPAWNSSTKWGPRKDELRKHDRDSKHKS